MSNLWRGASLAATLLVGSQSGAIAGAAEPVRACPTVEIATLASAGEVGARPIPGSDGAVDVSHSLITTGDIRLASPAVADGQPVLILNFKPAAAGAFRAYTAAHVGDSIVFIVDGKVVKVARIFEPIVGDGIQVGPLTADDAKPLATALNRCASAAR
jgi:preprotein translocase subunit SecD